MQTQSDQVDSSLTNYLLSESSDDDGLSGEEDLEFNINPISGLWEGSRGPSKVLYKNSGDSRGRYGLINPSVEAELKRPSDSSSEADDNEPLIHVR